MRAPPMAPGGKCLIPKRVRRFAICPTVGHHRTRSLTRCPARAPQTITHTHTHTLPPPIHMQFAPTSRSLVSLPHLAPSRQHPPSFPRSRVSFATPRGSMPTATSSPGPSAPSSRQTGTPSSSGRGRASAESAEVGITRIAATAGTASPTMYPCATEAMSRCSSPS